MCKFEKRQLLRAFVALLLFSSPSLLFAHHAMEYIEMESYNLARKGDFVLHIHYDYFVEDRDDPGSDHYEFTPGLSYGVTDYLMFDVHTHLSKFGIEHVVPQRRALYEPGGPSPFFEAAAFSLQAKLPSFFPVDVGLALSYEVPFRRSVDLLDGKKVFEGTLILSRDLGEHRNLCANLKFGKDGDEAVKEWALGAKTPLTEDPHGIAAGIEVFGPFEKEEGVDYAKRLFILVGSYFPLGSQNVQMKTGLGFNPGFERLRVNATLLYLF